jgi:TetR/AcrR family transcriptional regulator, acrAB operon repressor
MARKTKEDAELTYHALLDAAEKVFFEKGVANTTLNDVASAAGLTRGAVYWHFTDKAELLQTMVARAMLPVEAMLIELGSAGDTDPLDALRTMCVQALTSLATTPQRQRVFSILFHKCENVGEVVKVLEDKKYKSEECKVQIQNVLQRAVTTGRLPADTDVRLAHQIISNFMSGTMREWLFDPASYNLLDAAPGMVDMLLAGLRTCPPRIGSSTPAKG